MSSSSDRWDGFYAPPEAAVGDALVSDEMLVDPTVYEPSISVEKLREVFLNKHQQMALLVADGRLVATVERADLEPPRPAGATGLVVGTLDGRVVGPDVPLATAFRTLEQSGRRRLAVIDTDGSLLGLLCLKSSRTGFCSAQDVLAHRDEVRARGAANAAG